MTPNVIWRSSEVLEYLRIQENAYPWMLGIQVSSTFSDIFNLRCRNKVLFARVMDKREVQAEEKHL